MAVTDNVQTTPSRWLLPADRWNSGILAAFLLLWLASCIKPPYPEYLLLQHAPTVVSIVALVAVQNRLAVSRTSYALILAFLTVHLLGARYLYSNVPYDNWLKPILGFRIADHFHFERNHYDRLVHFLFGLLIVIPSYRFSRRILNLPVFWSAAVAFSVIMTASAIYEILEWIIAVTQSDTTAESYNGQQGDVWDPQWDMALAGLGSLIGLLLLAVMRRSVVSRKS